MTRVAVVDIGTNSTRLLVAEVADGGLRELARDSTSRAWARASTPPAGSATSRRRACSRRSTRYAAPIERHGAAAPR